MIHSKILHIKSFFFSILNSRITQWHTNKNNLSACCSVYSINILRNWLYDIHRLCASAFLHTNVTQKKGDATVCTQYELKKLKRNERKNSKIILDYRHRYLVKQVFSLCVCVCSHMIRFSVWYTYVVIHWIIKWLNCLSVLLVQWCGAAMSIVNIEINLFFYAMFWSFS